MVTVYLALGLLFLFTDVAINAFPSNRKPIGIIFLVYGSFRLILTLQKIRKAKEDEQQE